MTGLIIPGVPGEPGPPGPPGGPIPPGGVAGEVPTPDGAGGYEWLDLSTTLVRLNRQVIDVRDWGAIGDGVSRPLSSLYGSLAAAQADFPQATALTNELDWAAMQSLAHARAGARILVPHSCSFLTNLPLDVLSLTKWQIDGNITNTAARNTPNPYMDQANVFRVGNMHPVILKPGTGYSWPTVALNDVSAGERSVTVTTPSSVTAAGVTLAPGDFVIVRSDGTYMDAGAGRLYDYQQFNKVVSWNAGTGVLVLERPIAVAVTAGQLCINNGNIDTTTDPDQAWWMADQVVIEGHGRLSGSTPFGFKPGAWRSRLSVRGDFQDAGSIQAFVESELEVPDSTFTGRLAEVKFAAEDSRIKVRGRYVYSAEVPSPATTISVGEQASNITMDVDLTRGPDFPSDVNALEVWAQGITIRGVLLDYANAGQQSVYVVKSTDHTSRPPSDIDLSGLRIRVAGGRARYGLIGDDPAKTGAPTRIKLATNVRTPSGAAPTYLAHVLHGTQIDGGLPLGDTTRVNAASPGEVPQEADWVLSALGPVAVSSIAASNDAVNATGHGLANGQAIRFTSLTGGAGLSTGTTYYVTNRTANTFNVALTPGGATVDVTTIYTAATYALVYPASTETPHGIAATLIGVKTGDWVRGSLQQLLTPTSGSFSDLVVSCVVSATSAVQIHVRNRSTTDVVFASGVPFWVNSTWRRMRP